MYFVHKPCITSSDERQDFSSFGVREIQEELNLVIKWNKDSWNILMYYSWRYVRKISKYTLHSNDILLAKIWSVERSNTFAIPLLIVSRPRNQISRGVAREWPFFHFASASESSFQRQLLVLLHKRGNSRPNARNVSISRRQVVELIFPAACVCTESVESAGSSHIYRDTILANRKRRDV